MVQEALHNSVKHARPGRVDIRFGAHPDDAGTLSVEVTDDGVGFEPGVDRPGLGLSTMRERTGRLGGRLTVDSSHAGSTTVRAVLPGILRRPPTADTPATGSTPT